MLKGGRAGETKFKRIKYGIYKNCFILENPNMMSCSQQEKKKESFYKHRKRY